MLLRQPGRKRAPCLIRDVMNGRAPGWVRSDGILQPRLQLKNLSTRATQQNGVLISQARGALLWE
jgi:hypothetical protein